MIKILYVVGIWANGGIEKVVYTYCKNLPRNKYQIYLLPIEKYDSVFTNKIKKIGITILEPTEKVTGNMYKKYLTRKKILCNAVKNDDFDIVHFHNSLATSYLFIDAMKRISPKTKYILHSHGDNVEAPYVLIKKLLNSLIKNLYKDVPDFCSACSNSAGKWLFADSVFNSHKYETLFNAFDTEEYAFDGHKRALLKSQYNITSKYVVGTIGRFCYQKNPEFIIKVIQELDKKDEDFTFVWIGDGPDKQRIQKLGSQYGVDNRILYISYTDDVPGYLSLMDLFILPSRYEGLVLVLVEALASGLRCLASEVITRDTQITERISYLPIDKHSKWAEQISFYFDQEMLIFKEREYPKKQMQDSGFDIEPLIEKVDKIYSSLMEDK